jgi:3-oxoadipate enol-lactonase
MPYYSVNDIDIFYECSGKGSSVLFLHGLGSSSQDWEAQRTAFSARHRMITLDFRGHGLSSKLKRSYSIPLFAQDTADLINHLNIPSAHIVGISMGGMVAMQLALDAPWLINRLVIVNSAPAIQPHLFSLRQNLHFIQRRLVLLFFGMQGTSRLISNLLFPAPEQADLRRMCRERWAKNDRRAYDASMRAITRWNVFDRLPEIQNPTLVVAGKQDFIPLSYKQSYTRLIPRARLVVIENSRHATPVDQMEPFNRVVLDFLAQE